jgi:hypothetical protein
MSQERMPKALVQTLLQSRLHEQLGCKDATVVVKWGDDDGTNWFVELTGLPAPHRCLEAVETIATDLRKKFRLEKDRVSQDDLMVLLLNETLAELGQLGPGRIPFPPPPRPRLRRLSRRTNMPNWTAMPGGPVALEYMQVFNRVVARLQKQFDLELD